MAFMKTKQNNKKKPQPSKQKTYFFPVAFFD